MSPEGGHLARLRAGRTALIRRARRADEPGLLEAWVAMARDGRGMVADESEMTIERAQRAVTRYLEGDHTGDNGIFLVAEIDGRIAADATVHRLGAARVRHVAVLGIGVHPAFQGIGLGRAMMHAAVEWAEAQRIERLELAVRADNTRAIALYRSLGFTRESLRPRFVKLPDGTYIDDLVMVRALAPDQRSSGSG